MNYGLDPKQVLLFVIRPALQHIGLHAPASERLVLGTALQESRLRYLHQLGDGPARGLFQMEPATEHDIWDKYLRYNGPLAQNIRELMHHAAAGNLTGNLFYQAAMCRIHYRRVSAPLPGADQPLQMAQYWKHWYNTPGGAGTVEEAIPHFEFACGL